MSESVLPLESFRPTEPVDRSEFERLGLYPSNLVDPRDGLALFPTPVIISPRSALTSEDAVVHSVAPHHSFSEKTNFFERRLRDKWGAKLAIGAVGALGVLSAIRSDHTPPAPNPRMTVANVGILYYAPGNGDHPQPKIQPGVRVEVGHPTPANGCAVKQPKASETSGVGILAAEGEGRLGVIDFLKNNRDRWGEINYILLFDPGSLQDFKESCDEQMGEAQLIKDWLTSDPHNQLTILAGRRTADYDHPVNGYAHAGIQNTTFGKLHDTRQARQVAVCNYDWMESDELTKIFGETVNWPTIDRSNCPQISDAPLPVSWGPGN